MKSNAKISVIVFMLLVTLSVFSWFFWRQIRGNQRQIEIKVDEIEDARGLGYSGQRKIAIDEKGNTYVAYRKKYKGKSEIFVAKIYQNGKEWKVAGTDNPVSAVGQGVDQRVPSISIDKNNVVHTIWYGSDVNDQPDNRQIKYSKSEDEGATWSKWKNVSDVGGYNGDDYWQEHPFILSGDKNELFAVWEGKDENNKYQQIKFSKSTDGGNSWAGWKNIKETSGNTQSRPTLVQNGEGKLYLIAYSSLGDGSNQKIIFSSSDDRGETWSEWSPVSDSSFDSRHASAVVDGEGVLNLVWRAQKPESFSLVAFRSFDGKAWSEIKTVHLSDWYQFFPSIGVDEKGKINVTWMESENSSELPTEKPSGGKIYKSVLAADKFTRPTEISRGMDNLYPHIPEIVRKNGFPEIYESGSSKKYDLILKITG